MRVSGFSPEQAREVEGRPVSWAWSQGALAIEVIRGAVEQGAMPDRASREVWSRLTAEERAGFLEGLLFSAGLLRSGVEELLAALAREPGS